MIETDNGIVQFRDGFDDFHTTTTAVCVVDMMLMAMAMWMMRIWCHQQYIIRGRFKPIQRFETITDRMTAMAASKRSPYSTESRSCRIG